MQGPVSRGTLQAIERASGKLAATSVATMEARMPWFAKMPADRRASVLLIVQTGVAGFVEWFHDPQTAFKLSVDAFRTAPRDLYRSMNLRHTVELVRIALEILEQELPELGANERERAVLTEAILRYGREIAFAAATTYAGAAEARGAWDARLEALVVDGVVRGDAEESLLSRAAALGWGPSDEATVVVGKPSADDPPTVIYGVRSRAARLGRPVLLSVQGSRLVVVLGGHTDEVADADLLTKLAEVFGPGPVVAGPTVANLGDAHRSATDALSGLRAVVGWPAAPRPVRAADLLPERALAGDAGGGAAADRAGGAAVGGGRRRAAGNGGRLPGHRRHAGGVQPATVRARQHGALPAAQGDGADRTQRGRPEGRVGLANRARGRQAGTGAR